MTAVDPALYEAATIDGAGRVNQLWHITLPGLFPSSAFNSYSASGISCATISIRSIP